MSGERPQGTSRRRATHHTGPSLLTIGTSTLHRLQCFMPCSPRLALAARGAPSLGVLHSEVLATGMHSNLFGTLSDAIHFHGVPQEARGTGPCATSFVRMRSALFTGQMSLAWATCMATA